MIEKSDLKPGYDLGKKRRKKRKFLRTQAEREKDLKIKWWINEQVKNYTEKKEEEKRDTQD